MSELAARGPVRDHGLVRTAGDPRHVRPGPGDARGPDARASGSARPSMPRPSCAPPRATSEHGIGGRPMNRILKYREARCSARSSSCWSPPSRPGRPGFATPENLAGIFNDTSILIILALGQMAVILTRSIDLSVAANLSFTGMAVAMLNAAASRHAAAAADRSPPSASAPVSARSTASWSGGSASRRSSRRSARSPSIAAWRSCSPAAPG